MAVLNSFCQSRSVRCGGITQSHSRPHVSDDNPFSEAQFKTLKYRPDFPGHFTSIEAARQHCQILAVRRITDVAGLIHQSSRPDTWRIGHGTPRSPARRRAGSQYWRRIRQGPGCLSAPPQSLHETSVQRGQANISGYAPSRSLMDACRTIAAAEDLSAGRLTPGWLRQPWALRVRGLAALPRCVAAMWRRCSAASQRARAKSRAVDR
jgi:hypothetical protein